MAETSSSEKSPESETKPAENISLTSEKNPLRTLEEENLPKSPLMPSKAAGSSTIVWVDQLAEVETTLELINKESMIALDCEGYNLGKILPQYCHNTAVLPAQRGAGDPPVPLLLYFYRRPNRSLL